MAVCVVCVCVYTSRRERAVKNRFPVTVMPPVVHVGYYMWVRAMALAFRQKCCTKLSHYLSSKETQGSCLAWQWGQSGQYRSTGRCCQCCTTTLHTHIFTVGELLLLVKQSITDASPMSVFYKQYEGKSNIQEQINRVLDTSFIGNMTI